MTVLVVVVIATPVLVAIPIDVDPDALLVPVGTTIRARTAGGYNATRKTYEACDSGQRSYATECIHVLIPWKWSEWR
jgi:hypothetical protein